MSLRQVKSGKGEFNLVECSPHKKKNPKEMSYFETSEVSSCGQVQKAENEGTTEKTGPG